ncbi:DUF4344 domain-containing metallopeptidase [Shimia abyssi]|uniref:Putative metallopeptidase DUF4344 n=1 Tax=Shimia abyssi TaxID=1662395 RepID=A0A2P8FET0_9RHOB|nr:DUF4344 domain-containing metallopeptidase [Shimia abyssi]PSL20178.1 putative metallopeptidase DUF4344 [Shimia abyssi]
MINKFLVLIAMAYALATPARAEVEFDKTPDEVLGYVESNLLGIFYHELGHALIDILGLPIFGQEEDAADVLSVFLIDAFYEEDTAVQLAYDTAFGFLGEAENTGDVAFWDVHGPDLQRYYNLVCIFYGANPDERDDVAQDLGLPQDRAEYCPDEYEQAADSWGRALDEVTHPKGGKSIQMHDVDVVSDGGQLTLDLISDEIAALNMEFRLPETLRVSVIPCEEANAFYDPQYAEIVMCTEFADWLVEIAPE